MYTIMNLPMKVYWALYILFSRLKSFIYKLEESFFFIHYWIEFLMLLFDAVMYI